MHDLARALYESSHRGSLPERALEGAMAVAGGDFGNVQIRAATNGKLRIAAEYGFSSEFLEYFAVVEDDTSACGRAASRRSQVVIVDVNEDPAFAPHREIAAASRFRAVQSTPLVDPAGRLRGVISTHFRRSQRPSRRDLLLMQWYAEHVGAALAQQPSATCLFEAAAALHEHTADLHDDAAARMKGSALALLVAGNGARAHAVQERARRAHERARQARARAQAPTTP
jgi:GAF domain-containing protein